VRAPPTCKYPVGDGANRSRCMLETTRGRYRGKSDLPPSVHPSVLLKAMVVLCTPVPGARSKERALRARDSK
jgi:hypothetical protein